MKRLTGLLSLFLIFSGNNINAQERVLDRGSEKNMQGLKRMGETPFYYTYFGAQENNDPKAKAKTILEVFNDTLGSVQRIEFMLDKGEEIIAMTPTMDRNLFVMTVNPTANSRTIMLVDGRGEVLKSQVEKGLEKDAMLPENQPLIYSSTPEEFLIFYPASTQSGGYRLKTVDRELEERWTQTYAPKDGSWKVDKVSQVGPMLLVLQRETAEAAAGEHGTYTIRGIEVGSGSVMFSTALTDTNKALQYPTFLNFDMGRLTVGGVVFNNGKPDSKESDGAFFMMMSLHGDVMSQGRISWESALALNNKEVASLFNSKSFIVPRGVVFLPPEMHVLVAEVLSPSSGTTQPYSVQSTDLVAFTVDRDGNLVRTTKIKKTPEDIQISTPIVMFSDAVRTANSGAPLSYRGSFTSMGGNNYLAYTETVKDTTRLQFYPLDSFAAEKISSIPIYFSPLGKTDAKADKNIPTEILINPQGRVLFYGYRGRGMHLASRPIVKQTIAGKAPKKPAVPQPPRPPEPPLTPPDAPKQQPGKSNK